MTATSSPQLRSSGWQTAVVCSLLLAIYAVLAFTAAWNKTATYDETLHLVGGVVNRELRDYRVDPEDGAAFQWWGSLPVRKGELKFDTSRAEWPNMLEENTSHWYFVARTLYQAHGVDADSVLRRCRAVMLVLGVAAGALVAWTAFRLAGGVAAIVACALFSLDPTFLGHGLLVKNDVVFTLAMLLLSVGLWRAGVRLNVGNLALLVVACALGITVKFSGVLLPAVALLGLMVRAIGYGPWWVFGRELQRRGWRVAVAGVTTVLLIGTSYLAIWASYGFQRSVTPGGHGMPTDYILNSIAMWSAQHDSDRKSEWPEIAAERRKHPGVAISTVVWMNEHKLLPEPWAVGYLITQRSTYKRDAFLCNEYSSRGWVQYFPLAMSFKTPVGTLAAMFAAVGVLAWRAKVKESFRPGWATLGLGLAPAVYGLFALGTNINVGVRHVLPVYPALFLMTAVAATAVWRTRSRWRWAIAVCLGGLALETGLSYPNYVAFFNFPSRMTGPINLLSDSNLDWGQDLPALAKWQQAHPDEHLYLAYFGTADPEYYGIKYEALSGGYALSGRTPVKQPRQPGVIAVSATTYQGTFLPPAARRFFSGLAPKPREVLNGTIYLFDFPGVP